MTSDWSKEEVILIVNDYFDMLIKELSGQDYIKAEHRREISKFLNNRSEGSIEFKHQNISAVLIEMGLPYISGYKPRGNYQQLLKEAVEEHIIAHPGLDDLINKFLSTEIQLPVLKDINYIEVDVPEFKFIVKEPTFSYGKKSKTNYYEKELRNKRLGLLGEEFVINYEKQRLSFLGLDSLTERIEHVSQTEGDSAGFDILSFNESGKEKFIEVKTTKLGKEAPFYFTRNELKFSKSESKRYHLYRLFNFKRKPRFYQLKGSLDETCFSISTEFMGWPK